MHKKLYLFFISFLISTPVLANEANSGDTSWLLTSTALVLFMTLPGLALFYAGLVRSKNSVSVLMQCFALTALITILWVFFGYSLAFDTTGLVAGTTNLNSFVGGLSKAFLKGIDSETLSAVSYTNLTLPTKA